MTLQLQIPSCVMNFLQHSHFHRRQEEATMEETVNGGGQHEEPRGTNGQVSDNGSNETDAGGLGQA